MFVCLHRCWVPRYDRDQKSDQSHALLYDQDCTEPVPCLQYQKPGRYNLKPWIGWDKLRPTYTFDIEMPVDGKVKPLDEVTDAGGDDDLAQGLGAYLFGGGARHGEGLGRGRGCWIIRGRRVGDRAQKSRPHSQ